MTDALKRHWPEYAMEAAGLGLFMVSACVFGTLLEHPSSHLREAIAAADLRRALMGLAMGATAIAIIYSPWGKQSGAHLNPSVTLAFLGLGRVAPADALFYVAAQFLGGVAGVILSAAILGDALADAAVNFVATVPGRWGAGPAFAAELLMSALMMAMVLGLSDSRRFGRFTGLGAGALVALYITLVAPISGMSLNPARSLASALPAQHFTGLWIYFSAPVLGMQVAALGYSWARARPDTLACAKLHHQNRKRCIFCEGRGAKPPRAGEHPRPGARLP